MRKHILQSLVVIFCSINLYAQEATLYEKPPKEIEDLIDVPLAPAVAMDKSGETILFYSRDRYKSIEQLSQQEMRLGGLRINPVTNIGSRTTFYNDMELGSTKNNTRTKVKGLPATPQLSNFQFSPNDKYISFTHTTTEGEELWIVEIASSSAKKLTSAILNDNIGQSVVWARDSQYLL